MKDSRSRRASSQALAVSQALAKKAVPIALRAPSIKGTAVVGSVLNGVHGKYTGNTPTFTYRWLRDGVAIAGATQQYYVLRPEDADAAITFEETPTNNKGPGDANVSLPVIVRAALGDLTLSASQAYVGDTVSIDILGAVPGSLITGVVPAGLTINSSQRKITGTPTAASTDPIILIESKPGALYSPNTSTIGFAVGLRVPVNTGLPVISGTAQVGQTVTVSNGTWSGNPTSFTYQWYRNGVAIAGAVNASRFVMAADLGTVLTCAVVAINAGGPSLPALSAATSAVIDAPSPLPVNQTLPVVSGIAQAGQTLSTTNGTWTNSPTGYDYQWRADGINIPGATSSTYLQQDADVGKMITCRVTAKNTGGGTPAVSVAVGPVAARPASVPNQTATFGALTAADGVGFKPLAADNTEASLTGTPTLVSGSLGAYTAKVTNGRLTFSGAAGAPDGAVLRCTLATGGTVDITVSTQANTYTVGSTAELKAFLALPAATKGGKTCIVRVPDTAGYGMTNADWSGKFLNPVAKVYLRGEKPTLLPLIGTGGVFTTPTGNNQPQGKVDFSYLEWRSPSGAADQWESKMVGNFSDKGTDMFTTFPDVDDVRVANCRFTAQLPVSRLTGMRPRWRFQAIETQATNVVIEDNVFDNIVVGVEIGGANTTVRRNTFTNFWDDPMRVAAISGSTVTNVLIENNVCYGCIGDHGYHPDMLHMFPVSGSPVVDGVTVQGNVFWPGVEGALAPAWPVRKSSDDPKGSGSAYFRETTTTVGNRALTIDDHQKMIFVDARTTASTLSLPPLSSVGSTANKPDILIQSWFQASAGITIVPADGDLLYDGDLGQYVTNTVAFAPWETVFIWRQTSPSRWAVQRASAAYQGVFTNDIIDPGYIGNVGVNFNLLWVVENAVRDSNNLGGPWSVCNNSAMPPWYNLESSGGFYTPKGSDRFLLSDSKTNSKAAGNICGTVTKFTGDNVKSTELDLNNSWSAITGAFSVDNPLIQKWAPTTLADAIRLARPKALGVLPTGMGVGLSVDPADDHYNFGQFPAEPVGFRRNTPWEVLRLTPQVISGGVLVSWGEPAYVGHGAISGYECQYTVNGGAWQSATVTGTSASISGRQVNDVVVVRVRAINANGAGVWTRVPGVTITEAMPGPPPVPTSIFAGFVPTVGSQLQSGTFAVSGDKPVLVCIEMRTSSSTSPVTATATIGASGRSFGTGTALTLVASHTLVNRNMHTFMFLATGLTAATGQTIQLTSKDSSGAAYNVNGVSFDVLEFTGARTVGVIGASAGFTINPGTSLSVPLATVSNNSTIIGIACLGSATAFSATGFDSIISQRAPNGATQTVVAQRATALPGNYLQSFSWTGSFQCSGLVVEVKASV